MTAGRIDTVSIIGLGAIGSSYSAKISDKIHPENIRVIASGTRAEHYKASGVTVNGVKYFFPVYAPDDDVDPADLLIFAVKSYNLREAISAAVRHLGPDTIVLSLLNGITSERIIRDSYGTEGVLYSVVMGVDATRTDGGTSYSTLGVIPFGEARNEPGAFSNRVKLVAEFFERTGIAYEIPLDMTNTLWKKFMINVGANQISAILRAPYGILQQTRDARELVVSAMKEVLALAPSEGVNLTERDIDDCLAILDRLSPVGKTSMLQDVEACRPTEVDIFAGTVLELGQKHNVQVPLNSILFRMIRALEGSYQRCLRK
ncbi:MAG: 2-dehydropantoate 2-reductase [Synergistaceae bacterium]|jgi:2-dehydropantoate 2-reductase|nr:2-dehydropantoate 2-reductase [Synergistaceae bacterium]